MGKRDLDADIGDLDAGDYDPTEVQTVIPNKWHPSFKFGPAPFVGGAADDEGKRQLKAILEKARANEKARRIERCQPVFLHCWHDTPELYRKMIAAAAGLPRDVVGKVDRDLTETEKVMLRAAVSDMLLSLSPLRAL